MNDADRLVAVVAARQYGLLTRRQARQVGFSDATIGRRVEAGRWDVLHPSVFRIAGAPASIHQQWLAGALWGGPDSVVSHGSAGRLLKLDGVPRLERVHVTVLRPANPRSRSRVTVHRTLALDARDRTMVDGIPCTSPARTIIDLAATLRDEPLEAAFETARRLGLMTTANLSSRFATLGGHGRAGSAKVRRLIEANVGERPLESRLEVRAARLLRRSLLPAPVRQHRVVAASGERYRLDFAWPERRVAVETEGFAWHGNRYQWKRDRRRVAAIELLGWRLVFATWDDVTVRPDETLHRVALALGEVAA